MPPVTIVATLKGINGKPSDPGAAPMVDISLRTEATPELLSLFGNIGKEFDLTFARRGEQLTLFEEGFEEQIDDGLINEDTTEVEAEAEETEAVEAMAANGVADEAPARVPAGRRR